MKSFICTVTLLLAITMLIAILPTESEAAIYNDTVRLHILANSDEDIDQNTKLCVRDYLLKNYSESLNAEGGADTARKKAEALLPEIERDINGYLHSLGIDYGCTLTLGEEWYDTREYENFTMPKGIYTSLIVKLGNASGKNWWCVM